MKYSLDTVKNSWTAIFNSCELPNGQIAGRLPKMKEIEKILFNNRMEKVNTKHESIKREEIPSGLVTKLWGWGIEFRDGKITKHDLEKLIEEYGVEEKRKI
tara:strand:+ start:360 stop:662 length:303 start_codon:yes stop_codon:yes gene_type:complete